MIVTARVPPADPLRLERNPVPVVPMAASGLWGSIFSRRDGQALRGERR